MNNRTHCRSVSSSIHSVVANSQCRTLQWLSTSWPGLPCLQRQQVQWHMLLDTTTMGQLRRSVRPKTDSSTTGRGNAINPSNTYDKDYQSAIAKHLPINNDRAKLYCNECFSVLSRARSRKHLEILESIIITFSSARIESTAAIFTS